MKHLTTFALSACICTSAFASTFKNISPNSAYKKSAYHYTVLKNHAPRSFVGTYTNTSGQKYGQISLTNQGKLLGTYQRQGKPYQFSGKEIAIGKDATTGEERLKVIYTSNDLVGDTSGVMYIDQPEKGKTTIDIISNHGNYLGINHAYNFVQQKN